MGMRAYLTGVGYFHKAVAGVLEYPAEYYDNVAEGALIASDLTTPCATSEKSRELATALGVDINDPTTWWINNPDRNTKIDMETLKSILDDNELLAVTTALEFRFHLFFRPNM